MRRDVYSSTKLAKEKDNFIWIYVSHNTPNYNDWVKKYRNRHLPTVHFCTFDGKAQNRIAGIGTLSNFFSRLKKLKRKNKTAWKKEKAKRDKKKAEKEKKDGEEKKGEEKNKDDKEKKDEEKDDKKEEPPKKDE